MNGDLLNGSGGCCHVDVVWLLKLDLLVGGFHFGRSRRFLVALWSNGVLNNGFISGESCESHACFGLSANDNVLITTERRIDTRYRFANIPNNLCAFL